MTRTNLTFTTGILLHCIAHGRAYGFDIMDVSGLPDGTVYPALRRLEAAGLLIGDWESEQDAGSRPTRRYYRLTPDGYALLNRALEQFPGLSRMGVPRPGEA